jgi:hypothetical protein
VTAIKECMIENLKMEIEHALVAHKYSKRDEAWCDIDMDKASIVSFAPLNKKTGIPKNTHERVFKISGIAVCGKPSSLGGDEILDTKYSAKVFFVDRIHPKIQFL